jgi:hypothetical protein
MRQIDEFGPLFVLDHPLIQHKLTLMRDRDQLMSKSRDLLREVAMLMVIGVALSGCVPVGRDLRNPQTGETATCTWWTPIYGDFFPSPDGSYCKCMSSHLAVGYQVIGRSQRPACRSLSESQPLK